MSPSHATAPGERIRTVIVDDHDDIGRLVARRIADTIRAKAAAGGRAVLGLATGSTPIGVYRELIRLHREEGLSFANVISFNLDEYYPMDPESLHSYHRFMWENLFSRLDIAPANVHIPRGDLPRDQVEAQCRAYEEAIRQAGGIDLQLLGVGRTGHIGFNEPGSGLESRTRLITLDLVTRKDAAADFFGEENVPREAITMGVATILEAREIVILATGEHKAAIVRRAVEGDVDYEVAATFLQLHPSTTFYIDRAAAAGLTREATPWLLGAVEWTPELTVRAVVWLSHRAEKAILKLTQRDYAEHRLSSLVARHGSPGALNGLVFNALGSKIRGRSKLPRDQRVICFSPHPDDDVISMGGILRKLVENDNEITVAYMTSGSLAVFDHDVRRHLDFMRRLAGERHIAEEAVDELARRVDPKRLTTYSLHPGVVASEIWRRVPWPLRNLANEARANYRTFTNGAAAAVDTGTLSRQSAEALRTSAGLLRTLDSPEESAVLGDTPEAVTKLSAQIPDGATLEQLLPLRDKIASADHAIRSIDETFERRDAAAHRAHPGFGQCRPRARAVECRGSAHRTRAHDHRVDLDAHRRGVRR